VELLNASIEPDFERAGWYPGRRVDLPTGVPDLHPAAPILMAFGGLKVGVCGPGAECATSDIEFILGDWGDPLAQDWEHLLRTQFVSIAECHHGHGQLLLDAQGRLFQGGLVGPTFTFEGPTFAEGVEAVLRGRKSRPMLLPWQASTHVWGETFRSGDPRLMPLDLLNVRKPPRSCHSRPDRIG
jgi:hypothetical protein